MEKQTNESRNPTDSKKGLENQARTPHPETETPKDTAKGSSVFDQAIEILRKEYPVESASAPRPTTAVPNNPTPSPQTDPQPLQARMLNEFVYCPRLFYYELVECVFVESADTLRGKAIHQRVDTGKGDLPEAKAEVQSEKGAPSPGDQNGPHQEKEAPEKPETIHSRSVQMGSERLGVVAKMDLVEVRRNSEDLFALEVCPVDYKAGSPKPGQEGNELWDTDKMQLGLQALILRDNGYSCNEGIIYYRGTRQRVRLAITTELETWIEQKVREAREVIKGPIPPPLFQSPKCVRCSLAPVCLPDETVLLSEESAAPAEEAPQADHTETGSPSTGREIPPRRLIAARDDTRSLYLNTQGLRVGCKDEVLQVKEKDRVSEEVRLRDVSHVALFGNIQISTQAIQTLCKREIPITYFTTGGWFYGITRGHGLKNVFLRMEQFRLARDPSTCLALARKFVYGKIRNHRTMLMRNHLEPPAPVLLKLKRAAEDATQADSLDSLLGIEGAAASLYFQEFSGMIKITDEMEEIERPNENNSSQPFNFNFNFTHRNRRPPTDPVNALLSLAYSVLAKDCMLATLAVGFDPYVGYYHQPRFGRPALGLDLLEEFRPLIAESTVLSCINNRVVTEKDFVRAGQAVNLSQDGRKRFFQMYENRMNALITHPLFDYKVSYRRALELQARLLAKVLTGEIHEYLPMQTR